MQWQRTAVGMMLLVLGSCAPIPSVSAFSPGQQPHLGSVPGDGVYGLFRDDDDTPLVRLSLTTGQPLGFDRRQGGTVGELQISYLVAVAGNELVPLQNGQRYYWRRM